MGTELGTRAGAMGFSTGLGGKLDDGTELAKDNAPPILGEGGRGVGPVFFSSIGRLEGLEI